MRQPRFENESESLRSTGMKLKDQVDIDATPEQAWPFLADPVIQAAWNPKIVSIDRAHDGPVLAGETFTMVATMNDKKTASRVEVADVVPQQRLIFRHHVEESKMAQVVTETYTLSSKGSGARVRHTIDLSQTSIPLLVRPIIWLVMTFGKPTGPQPLGKLKALIESEVSA